MPTPIKVAGVPEAFNDCWQTATTFPTTTTRPTFIPHPSGTASMLTSLLNHHVNAAFALTDCIVASIENGAPLRLAAPLVKSPLTWAVIVSSNSPATSIHDLSAATWGVSRLGSGSHLMVRILARERDWDTQPVFQVCDNFAGLRAALAAGSIDAFLWEHFTTRPYEERGVVKILGGVPTPWGCFSVVVRSDCEEIEEVFKVVDGFLEAAERFVADPGSVAAVAGRYGMSGRDAAAWIAGVRYARVGERKVASGELVLARDSLLDAGVINEVTFESVDLYHV